MFKNLNNTYGEIGDFGGWSTDMCSFELRVIWTKGQLDYIEGLG